MIINFRRRREDIYGDLKIKIDEAGYDIIDEVPQPPDREGIQPYYEQTPEGSHRLEMHEDEEETWVVDVSNQNSHPDLQENDVGVYLTQQEATETSDIANVTSAKPEYMDMLPDSDDAEKSNYLTTLRQPDINSAEQEIDTKVIPSDDNTILSSSSRHGASGDGYLRMDGGSKLTATEVSPDDIYNGPTDSDRLEDSKVILTNKTNDDPQNTTCTGKSALTKSVQGVKDSDHLKESQVALADVARKTDDDLQNAPGKSGV